MSGAVTAHKNTQREMERSLTSYSFRLSWSSDEKQEWNKSLEFLHKYHRREDRREEEKLSHALEKTRTRGNYASPKNQGWRAVQENEKNSNEKQTEVANTTETETQ